MTRKVLITGAAGGIGDALCRYFKERGFDVIAHARKEDQARVMADEGDYRPVWGDLTKQSDIDAIADQLSDVEVIDMLVNNAGVLTKSTDLTEDGVGLHAAINVIAPLRLTLALMPKLTAAEDPVSVIVSSGAADLARSNRYSLLAEPDGSALFGQYALSKSAANALVIAMAKAFPGLRVLSTEPGFVKTPMTVANDGMSGPMTLMARAFSASPEKAAHRCFDHILEAMPPSGTIVQNGKDIDSAKKKWSREKAMEELRALLAKVGISL